MQSHKLVIYKLNLCTHELFTTRSITGILKTDGGNFHFMSTLTLRGVARDLSSVVFLITNIYVFQQLCVCQKRQIKWSILLQKPRANDKTWQRASVSQVCARNRSRGNGGAVEDMWQPGQGWKLSPVEGSSPIVGVTGITAGKAGKATVASRSDPQWAGLKG